jgi:hypothetical protein
MGVGMVSRAVELQVGKQTVYTGATGVWDVTDRITVIETARRTSVVQNIRDLTRFAGLVLLN